MRSTARVADVSLNTVAKLPVDAGAASAAYHDATVRDVQASSVQCDELRSFCDAKAKTVARGRCRSPDAGDLWTWTGIDPATKLILS